MRNLNYVFMASILLLASCSSNKKELKQAETALICPAFKNVDIPSEEYTLDAEKGDTIYYSSGSILLFPKNSFVDKTGNLIKGEVKVTYREFANPIDFFISGIPMNYDSCGTQYVFESSGMCEINAFQNGNPVFVNQKSKPQINMVTTNTDANHNLYFLDPIQKRWISKGKNKINDFTKELANTANNTETPNTPNAASKQQLAEPIKPLKENKERPSFSITIDTSAMPELQAYNHLSFEIAAEEKNYNPKYGDIIWQNVKIERGSIKGTYLVTFSRANQTVSFLTRPVIEAKAYDQAMQVYKKKKAEYDKRFAEKMKLAEEHQRVANKKAMNQFDSLNQIIETRNKQIKLINDKTLADNENQLNSMDKILKTGNLTPKEQEKRVKEYEQYMNEIKKAKALAQLKRRYNEGGISIYGDIYRTFALDGFGVWNSDNPILLSVKGAIKIKATFVDENNNKLNLNMVQVVYKSINGINANHEPSPDFTFPDLDVIPKTENMIWAISNNRLYYLTYSDFMAYQITDKTKEQTFKLKLKADSTTSVDEVKRLLKDDM